jgi:hypothetical protein
MSVTKTNGWIRVGLVVAVLAGFGCQPQRPVEPSPPKDVVKTSDDLPPALAGGKPLLMHYMPWYKTPEKRGAWGSHWTGHEKQHNPSVIGADGLPDIWSHYHPLIGLYDSTDADVLMCQLLQMKFAGVDGVIADWYGIAPTADYPEVHEATQALFAATKKAGMYFAVCYEDRSVQLLVEWGKLQPAETTNHLADTFQWMQTNWFTDAHYYRINDRPLLLNFGPVYLQDPATWTAAMALLPVRPAFFALHHLWRQAGADGGFTWVHYDPWSGDLQPSTIRTRIGEVFTYFSKNPAEVIVSAYPGFNDVYRERHPELAHRNGETLRETLSVAMAGPWPLVQLITWNDYGEGTIIEPTHEFGYTFLEVIQQERRAEIGAKLPYTADDLRLPAAWLALKKSGKHDEAKLNHIEQLLRLGYTGIARTEIEKLSVP